MGLFSTPTVKTPATGIYNTPSWLQSQYNTIGQAIPGATTAAAFTRPDFNADQQSAFQMARNAANPTMTSIQALTAPFQNAYDESVVNQVNREAAGQNSLVNQAAIQAGQQGSNRNFLETSDVEQNRLNNINQFKQQQYNTSLNTALGQQQQGIQNLSAFGNQQQDQAFANQQAPFQALLAQSQLLNPLAQMYAGSRQESSAGGGLDWSKIISTGGKIASLFSDINVKQDIEYIGDENGHKMYKFAYKVDPSKKYIGVMAQDVEKTHPDAVSEVDGVKLVNYGKIGVRFREAD